MKAWMSGSVAGTGTFRCTECDFPVSLDAADELPTCGNCGGTEFVRSSLFTTSQQPIVELDAEIEDRGWLDELRVTLVNHSTVLLQWGGLHILTDPIWSERASPFGWIGPRRLRAAGVRIGGRRRWDQGSGNPD